MLIEEQHWLARCVGVSCGVVFCGGGVVGKFLALVGVVGIRKSLGSGSGSELPAYGASKILN